MRVLHVHDHDPAGSFGGAEVYVSRLVQAQRDRGHDVDVLFPLHAPSRRRSPLLDLWDQGSLRVLRRRVQTFRPEVVHVHGFVRELSPSVLVATGTPTVLTFHDLRLLGGSEHRLPAPRAVATQVWVAPLALRLARRVRAVTGVSDVVTDLLRRARLPEPSTLLVPAPAPTTTLRPAGECRDVLFAGRLSVDKGPAVLLEAFARLAARHPDSTLLLAGDGPLRSDLERAAGDRVRFLGRLSPPEVSAVMASVRVVVVPSLPAHRREGSSMTTVEAARHARPVVCSDDPAVAEVGRRVGADVVPAGDVAALASRLDHWLREDALAQRAGESAAAAAAVHDPAQVAGVADEVYARAVAT